MGPILTKIKNLFGPKTPVEPEPAPVMPDKPVEPEIPTINVSPSGINAVNYIRALMILRGIDFKKLREEFFKLPLKQLGIMTGLIVWCGLTYWFCLLAFRLFIVK